MMMVTMTIFVFSDLKNSLLILLYLTGGVIKFMKPVVAVLFGMVIQIIKA